MNDIITEKSGSILRVQLNRPAKKNAMTTGMYLTMTELLKKAAADNEIRVVVWHGAGDSFCAGNDIEDFLKTPPASKESPQEQLMRILIDLDKPLVAAVHGATVGGGTTMITHCDFVYAAENTRFQMPFINLAAVPEFGSSYTIPAWVGHIRASELILLGQPFTARRAAELGLVTRVVPDGEALNVAMEVAQQLAAKPAGALQASKRLLKRTARQQLEQVIRVETDVFTELIRSADAKEALTAFLEKRKPDFTKSQKSVAGT